MNFRQPQSRARRDLYEYLRGNCSLVNPDPPCRCAKKTRAGCHVAVRGLSY